jgi:hypothetical protein
MHLVAPLLLLAAAHVEVPQPTPLPGGFADPDGRIGVFNTPRGGIQAVELATGKSFWHTEQAKRPLFVADGRVYALAAVRAPVARGLCFEWHPAWDGPRNGFRLVAFDLTRFGEPVLESETVALPEWASLADTHDRSFAPRWRVEGGRLVVAWEASAWYAGPVKKTPQEEAAYRKRADGAVRFDLETGRFEALPAPPAPAAPPTVDGWKELERHAIRWQKATAGRHLVLTMEEERGTQTLTLRTFDAATRRQLDARELIRGKRLVVMSSVDEQYLCVRDAGGRPGTRGEFDEPAAPWSVFTADGGRRVADVPHEPGAAALAVLGGRAFVLVTGRIDTPLDRPFVVPRSLRAVDLRTGAVQWERPVGGTSAAPPALTAWPAPAARQPRGSWLWGGKPPG